MTWTGDPIPAPGRAKPSTAATLRPDPERAILDLCARHHLVRPIAQADQNAWRVAVRHVIAASNEVTAALRNDLPTDDRHDAAALWDSWRRAATRVRDRSKGLAPADAYPEPWEFRSQLELIGLAMASALARPGVFAARYCPWADDFYTAARLYPEESATATRNAAADREVEYEIQPGTSDRSTRGVHVAAPEISSVRFERSANPALPIGMYASLWDAEQAVRAAFERRPVDGAAPVSTVFRVEWADGARHRATLPTDAATVRDDAAFGLLKAYLMRQGRAFADSANPALRAWGAELRHRLANDRSHPDALADVAAWRASLAFLPTGTGSPPAVADVVVALGADALVPSPDDGGLVFDSIEAADAAIGHYARTAGPRAPAGAIVAVRVTWADGMRFTVWDPVPTVVRDPDGAAYIRAQIERRARHILAEGYAEKNARTLPRRDLAPQRAWAAELLRRLAADGPRNAAALPRVTEVRIRASENHAARRLVGQRFTSLRLADHALAHAFAVEPPPDDGADKTDFEVTWSDGASHTGTMDVTRAVLAAAAGGLLDRHLRRYRAMVRSASYEGTARALGLDLADRRAWAEELIRRLDAEALTTRNAVTAAPASADEDPPTIREVAILWSENPQIPTRTFPTLWEADAAIAAVLVHEPMSRARDKTGYLVTWTDGATHEGKLEASRADLADAAPMGGLLRRHLNDTAWWLRSQRFRDMFAAHRAPAEIARDQAWGRELLYRLASDKVDTVDVKAPRNRARRGGA